MKKLFETWAFDSYLTVKQKKWEINIKNSKQNKLCQESWLNEAVAGWDRVRKLNGFEERYLAWILLLQDETLVQEMKYLASHFCCFFGIMLHRNLEYLYI